MKKLYLMAISALTALSASAAAGDWVLLEDFENYSGTPALWDYMGGTPSGESEIAVVATEADADNHAAKFTGGNYNSALEIEITLPEGKTLADYKALDFDIFNYDMTYKSIFVYIDGTVVREPNGNDFGNDKEFNTWKHFTYELNSTSNATTVKVRVGFKIQNNSFALDNIRLQERGEAIQPGTYNETANGTTTDGWLMVQDFQTKAPGDMAALWGQYGSPSGTGEIAEDAADAKNLTAVFTGGDYNTIFEVSATLPEGKTLKDYKTLAFDLYRFSDDDNHKQMLVVADGETIHMDEGYPEQGKAEQWTVKTYTIPETTECGNSVMLRFGIKTNAGHYAVDNLRLEERATSTEPVEPVEYHPTANGTTTDGIYMANDFQHHAAEGIELPTWAKGENSITGTSKTAADPTDKQNLAAHFSGESNYNTVHEIEVQLPEGKTLANFATLKFDLYRLPGDADYKKMLVQADDQVLHYDDDYVQQAPEGEWTEKSYEIPADATAGNTFKLRTGIETDNANYMIDNVRLEPRRTTTGVESVATDATLSARGATGCIVLAGSGSAHIYNIDGRTATTVTVDGSATVALPAGIYVVAPAGGKAIKTAVR